MSNPFSILQAGVFASVPDYQGEAPLSALMIAALANRMLRPPAQLGPLDKSWWSAAFNAIPMLSATSEVAGSLSSPTALAIATVCLGSGVIGDVPRGRDALAAWIAAQSELPTTLSCIAATGTTGLIHVSLAFIDVGAGTFARTDGVINAVSAASAKQLQSIFGATEPLADEPYHCSLASAG